MLNAKKIEEIQKFIQTKSDYLFYAYRMYDIYNKNITPYLHERIKQNFRTETSASEAVSRLSTVNLLPKIVNKLSKAYSDVSIKNVSSNQKELDFLLENIDLKEKRTFINKMLNLHNCVSLKPFFKENFFFFRVLPAHTFLVYSDDELAPETPTHFIKIINANYKNKALMFKDSVIHIYDSDSYAIIKNNVVELIDEHPYKTLPFTYITKEFSELLPSSGQDDYEMVTLLPLLLTDNNFALKYKAFSIYYTLNCESGDMELAPNSIWNFKSSGYENDKPEIGVLTPTLNSEESIKNINNQYSLWLETKNLKSPVFSTSNSQSQELSGIAKIIDEADVASDVQAQRKILSSGETELLYLIETISV